MFAIPTHPYSCQPFASAQTHPTLYDLDYDLLAPYSYHQRQVALEEQARREAIACRYGQQEYEEQQAALAYRAALLRQLGLEEEERQNVEAQRQARLREQLRQQQEEERVRRKVVERTLISGPTLFDMLFGAPSPHAAPSQPTDDRPTALPAPPGIPVAFHPSSTPTSEPAPAADPPSPLLPIFGSSATGAHENDCHSIASSSDTHSSASSVSTDKSSLSPSKRASALSTLSSLISSLDARRSAFSSFDPSSLVFQPVPPSSSSIFFPTDRCRSRLHLKQHSLLSLRRLPRLPPLEGRRCRFAWR